MNSDPDPQPIRGHEPTIVILDELPEVFNIPDPMYQRDGLIDEDDQWYDDALDDERRANEMFRDGPQ